MFYSWVANTVWDSQPRMVGSLGMAKSRRIDFPHGKWSMRSTKTAISVLPYVQVPGELVRIFLHSLFWLWEALFWRWSLRFTEKGRIAPFAVLCFRKSGLSIHWWDTILPNYSSYKDWNRTTNGAILHFSVNLSDHLLKSASDNDNREQKKILTSTSWTWTYGSTDLAVFLPLVTHVPCENSILLEFSTPTVPTISVPFSEVRIKLGLRAVYSWGGLKRVVATLQKLRFLRW